MHNLSFHSFTPTSAGWMNELESLPTTVHSFDEMLNDIRRTVVAKHLALACIELAEAHQDSVDLTESYRQSEARYRAFVDLEGIGVDHSVLNALPVLNATPEQEITLVELLGALWGWTNVPHRQIQRDLIEAAKELLEGLAWRLPDPCAGRTTVQDIKLMAEGGWLRADG